MARIVTYTIVLAGVWMLLFMAGLNTGSSDLLSKIGHTSSGGLTSSAIAVAITALLALSATFSIIVVGLFTRQSVESALVATLASTLLTITFIDFSSIISYFFGICPSGSDCSFASWIVSTIFTVLWAGYLISIVQWWRGNDL